MNCNRKFSLLSCSSSSPYLPLCLFTNTLPCLQAWCRRVWKPLFKRRISLLCGRNIKSVCVLWIPTIWSSRRRKFHPGSRFFRSMKLVNVGFHWGKIHDHDTRYLQWMKLVSEGFHLGKVHDDNTLSKGNSTMMVRLLTVKTREWRFPLRKNPRW